MSIKKILVISIHPAPYRDPVLREMQSDNRYKTYILNLFNNGTTHKEWNYFDEKVNTVDISIDDNKNIKTFVKIKKYIIKNNIDIVMVPGINPTCNLLLQIWCKFKGIKTIYTADTYKNPTKNYCINFIYRRFIHFLIKKSEFIFIPGKSSEIYFREKIGYEGKIVHGSYCLDNDKLINNKQGSRMNNQKITFLFVGKLIKSRNIEMLLECFSDPKVKNNCNLIIIGESPDGYDYFKNKDYNNIKNIKRVEFNKLHKYYFDADAYIHIGEEPYSLALYEAYISEMPIISSLNVGAVIDCVMDGYNGIVLKNIDKNSICNAIIELSKNYNLYYKNATYLIKSKKYLNPKSIKDNMFDFLDKNKEKNV